MTDATMRGWHELRPGTVRSAVVLWWLTLGLTVLISFVAFTIVADRIRWDDMPRMLGNAALGTALVLSLVLCLFPAYVALVRQFEYGPQWARVTLFVLGAAFGTLALVQALDVFDDPSPSSLETVGAVLCLGHIVSVLVAFALSCLPAVNAHVRATGVVGNDLGPRKYFFS